MMIFSRIQTGEACDSYDEKGLDAFDLYYDSELDLDQQSPEFWDSL